MIFSDLLAIFFISLEDFSPTLFSFSREVTIFLVFATLKVFFSFWIFLKWLFDFYCIQPGILTHRRGILFPVTREFLLEEIENITSFSGFFGKVCDYGRVSIRFANEYFSFRRIPDPEHFVSLLHMHKTQK